MIAIIFSIVSLAISLTAAYMARESWYSSVHGLVWSKGYDGAHAFLVERMGFSVPKATRIVNKAVAKYAHR